MNWNRYTDDGLVQNVGRCLCFAVDYETSGIGDDGGKSVIIASYVLFISS